MPGLVPGIHVLQPSRPKDVDGRDKPGHDERLRIGSQCDHFSFGMIALMVATSAGGVR